MAHPIPADASRRPRLMVAEDDVDMAHVMRFLLQRQGWEVEVVPDGRAALARIDAGEPPELALIDVMMPFASGIQVVRHLRASGSAWRDVPVIVISGKSSERDIVEAFEAGADDYVTKPFRPAELVARVRTLLQRRRAVRVA